MIERASYLKAAPFERTVARVDHANGYKNKTMVTRLGAITFAVPQVRGSGYVTRSDEREPVARTIRAVFTAGDVNEANEKLKIAVRHWQSVHPMLATWAEENLSEGFAVFGLPEPHRARMRTTNGLERLNKEIKRRTWVATLFPNPESCLRLVSAQLSEQDEDWLSGKIYLTMKPDSAPM